MGFARRVDPDRFFATLFAPPAKRDALCVLIAFNHELARAREAASHPMAALIRLQWWRDALEEAASGQPPRRHEVAEPLHALIRAGTLSAAELTALVDAREAEVAEEGIPTEPALQAYLRAGAGGLAVAMGRVLGVPGAALPGVQALGAGYGLAGVLRSVAAHAAQGRCLLPLDALAAHGLSPEAVIADPTAAAPVVQALARAGLAALPRARVPSAAALPGVLARRDLARLAAGQAVPVPRGFGDRLAMVWAGLRGRG
ncbi:phytoene synthase [Humitalea rosea]|uniref:Phytoene synthase n=2 Tax=Humitalea rosea TaxID=990373 RepID=A0A2W7KLI4_9PROT|nr:phytoene synthase [Humitalea rosea]